MHSWTYDPKQVTSLDQVFTQADKGLFDSTYDSASKVALALICLGKFCICSSYYVQ